MSNQPTPANESDNAKPVATATPTPAQPMPAATNATALARAPAPDVPLATIGSDVYRTQLEPPNIGAASGLAKNLAAIQFCGAQHEADILARILLGREFGWGAIQSCKSIYVVYGRPSLEAQAMHALVLQSPLCEEFVCLETTTTSAKFRGKRIGQPALVMEFTIEEAKSAGLVKPDSNWVKWPRNMLRARAISNLANLLWPDVTRGMASREEMQDEMTGEVVATDAGPSAAISVTIDPKPVAGTQLRDFDGERAVIMAKIEAISSTATAAEARKAIQEWDAPKVTKDEVIAAYEAKLKAAKAAAAAAKAQAGAAPATTPPSPSPPPAQTPIPIDPNGPATSLFNTSPTTREPGEEG